MRQLSHIWIILAASGFLNIAWFPANFSEIFSTVDLTPKRLPHSMQAKGSSSFKTDWVNAASVRSNCGCKVIAFSGHTLAQSPHCRHASSWNRSCGRSTLSPKAPDGQSDTQAKHSVQAAVSTMTAPYGAFAGNGSVTASGLRAFADNRATCLRVPRGRIGFAIAVIGAFPNR